ncbi:tRNA threonylcarbamoyladenosine dehydratase [Castellaniella sp.]|uniref:tRNA threonylcarbamoyladenosine dehydratase n=1 Tax=Castellaniella sp. TaxID=1955812 RepID=UPI002AFE07E4|nr:tRNA threonylcarbamoyladenosine dehydratase [Castellaniella sp.]
MSSPDPILPFDAAPSEPAADLSRRFGGLDRLYGDGAWRRLSDLHVVVAGIGGVGTWCVEALARSGVGALTLVDMDHIAESNVNRQAHALGSTLGMAKIRAMADRVRDIHPGCRVTEIDDFVSADNIETILSAGPAGVLLDCTDQVPAKIAMILQARAQGWSFLVCGGAGGKTDPLALRAGDLSVATHDALLGRIRQELRQRHGYPKGGAAGGKPRRRVPRMGVSCLWFDQPVVLPSAWNQPSAACAVPDAGDALALPAAAPQGLSCAGYGSVVTVTASMGLAAANWALQQALSGPGR